jgi:hypothetical protein
MSFTVIDASQNKNAASAVITKMPLALDIYGIDGGWVV